MRGAEAILQTLRAGGVDVCFTNPGTSEMHFVAALPQAKGLRAVLGLFEGVVTGAADGYARMAERPAATLLHLGPGLANGLANLHNARKAHTPIVNLVGDHALRHRPFDAPLSADVEGFAKPVSHWLRTSRTLGEVARDAADALSAAATPPGRIATLIVPADLAWQEGAAPAAPRTPEAPRAASNEEIEDAAHALRSGEPCALLVGGRALRGAALECAGRIAAASGARLFCDTFNARWQRGAGRALPQPLPYFAEAALAALGDVKHLILAGTQAPVAFFAYPEKPSELTPPGCRVHRLVGAEGDCAASLAALAERLGAAQTPNAGPRAERAQPEAPRGALNPASIGVSLARHLPEGAVVSEEAITGSAALLPATAGAAPHDWLALTGGAIGQGLPVATGAALACPQRKVVCLEADGSALYTIQALWTQAREGLDVTTVILANRRYAILEIELQRLGLGAAAEASAPLFRLRDPELDWQRLAEGFGVPAARAASAEEFDTALARALAEPGPHLIEAVHA